MKGTANGLARGTESAEILGEERNVEMNAPLAGIGIGRTGERVGQIAVAAQTSIAAPLHDLMEIDGVREFAQARQGFR